MTFPRIVPIPEVNNFYNTSWKIILYIGVYNYNFFWLWVLTIKSDDIFLPKKRSRLSLHRSDSRLDLITPRMNGSSSEELFTVLRVYISGNDIEVVLLCSLFCQHRWLRNWSQIMSKVYIWLLWIKDIFIWVFGIITALNRPCVCVVALSLNYQDHNTNTRPHLWFGAISIYSPTFWWCSGSSYRSVQLQ